MEWLLAGMRKISVAEFIQWMKENGIQTGTPFETSGIWNVPYRPIGKEQKEKCKKHIELCCEYNLL